MLKETLTMDSYSGSSLLRVGMSMEVVLHDIAKIVYLKIHNYGLQFQ